MPPAISTQQVVSHYSHLALEAPHPAQSAHARKIAETFGYSAEELASVPSGANLGLSCGNPLAIAGLREGEQVLDLGCGAGFDVFQAARRVGASGAVIGVDASAEMLSRARATASRTSLSNVSFVQAEITHLPIERASVDCVVSNCVVNLLATEGKKQCFREVGRVLKPGGRVALEDVLARRPIPEQMRLHLGLFVGCVGGAASVMQYETWLTEAGLQDVVIVDNKSDLNIYKERGGEGAPSSCCATKKTAPPTPVAKEAAESCCSTHNSSCCSATGELETGNDADQEGAVRMADIDFNEWVGSFSVYAVKP